MKPPDKGPKIFENASFKNGTFGNGLKIFL